MSVILDLDEQALASLPLGPGERERHMQIELACRFYASGWLTLGQGARWRIWTTTPLAWRSRNAGFPGNTD